MTKNNEDDGYVLFGKADDPQQNVQRVADTWRITEEIRTGFRDEDGFSTVSKHNIFSEGDFVNVSLSFDPYRLRNRGTKVHLCPDEIIQMVAGHEVVSHLTHFFEGS